MTRPWGGVVAVALFVSVAAPWTGATSAAAGTGGPAAPAALPDGRGADFDGDGFADLAMAEPGETVDGVPTAGSVLVLYGTATGLSAERSQHWTDPATTPGLAGTRNDPPPDVPALGAALATGDFDGDGYDDLAAAAPGGDVRGVADAGGVLVLYGSPSGLGGGRLQRWNEDTAGVVDAAEEDDRFGAALVAADVGGGPEDDLVVGVPGEVVGQAIGAGAVHVLFGSGEGLTAAEDYRITENTSGVDGQAERGDEFGIALAAGRFDGAGPRDLAVAARGDAVAGASEAGAVYVFEGGAGGPVPAAGAVWTQDSPGVPDAAEQNDHFGAVLAAGDLDGDGTDDLAVGVPDENLAGPVLDAGGVAVLHGSASGLSGAGWWHQDKAGVEEVAEAADNFGSGLAAGDLDGDGFDDLAVGIEDEWVGPVDRAGAVAVLYGTATGLAAAGDQFWHQDSPGVDDTAEAKDHWGTGLAVGAYAGGAEADLAVGAMDDTVAGVVHSGLVNVLPGSPAGLAGAGGAAWHQEVPGVAGDAAVNDKLGFRLA